MLPFVLFLLTISKPISSIPPTGEIFPDTPGRRNIRFQGIWRLLTLGITPPRFEYRAAWSMFVGMRVKTSVTLPEDLLRSLDRAAGGQGKRSRLIEQAVRALLEARARADRDTKEIALINRHADRLNEEAADVLEYQVKL